MRPNQFWEKELLEDWRGRKGRVMKFLFPLILIGPVLLSPAPNSLKTDLIGVMVLFIGVFGGAIGLIRNKESKMLERLAMLPITPFRLLSEYIFAKSLFAAAQLLPPLVLLILLNPSLVPMLGMILLFYFISVIAASIIGVLVAVISGSSGEVHLFAAIIVLGIGGLSGFFMDPTSGIMSAIVPYSPFSMLSAILLSGMSSSVLMSPYLALISIPLLFIVLLGVSKRIFSFE